MRAKLYPGRDLNSHGTYVPRDFKYPARLFSPSGNRLNSLGAYTWPPQLRVVARRISRTYPTASSAKEIGGLAQ